MPTFLFLNLQLTKWVSVVQWLHNNYRFSETKTDVKYRIRWIVWRLNRSDRCGTLIKTEFLFHVFLGNWVFRFLSHCVTENPDPGRKVRRRSLHIRTRYRSMKISDPRSGCNRFRRWNRTRTKRSDPTTKNNALKELET